MSAPFGGVWPAVVTPVAADGSPALDVVEKLVDLFAGQRLGGLYLTGSTGQWPLFTPAERMAVAERAVAAAAGRIPVMVHVGAATTADAARLAEHAEKIGADAVSAVGPIYYLATPAALFAHYWAIASACRLPFYGYHFGGVSQSNLGAREYVERLLEIPTAAGMKVTDKDLYPLGLLSAYAGGRLRIFSGADEVMCHGVLSGAIGAIGTFYNVWGPACQAAWHATAAGDAGAGAAFMARFQPALDAALSGGMWSYLRAAMRLKYGLDIGTPRPPLGVADKPWADDAARRVLAMVDGDG